MTGGIRPEVRRIAQERCRCQLQRLAKVTASEYADGRTRHRAAVQCEVNPWIQQGACDARARVAPTELSEHVSWSLAVAAQDAVFNVVEGEDVRPDAVCSLAGTGPHGNTRHKRTRHAINTNSTRTPSTQTQHEHVQHKLNKHAINAHAINATCHQQPALTASKKPCRDRLDVGCPCSAIAWITNALYTLMKNATRSGCDSANTFTRCSLEHSRT